MNPRLTYKGAESSLSGLRASLGAGREGRLRLAVVTAIGALAAGVIVWALSGGVATRAPAADAAPAAVLELVAQDVAVAEVRALRRDVPLTGTLQPLEQTEVKAQVAGQIAEVTVRPGDAVARDQVLARLGSREHKARLDEKLANLSAGQAQLTLARKKRESTRALHARSLISQSELDTVESEYRVSAAQVASLQAQVEQSRKALEDAVVQSPIDGVVSERLAQPGTAVTIGTPLFHVVDLSIMELAALVPASDIPAVQIGQEATFQVEGFGERSFAGNVERINPATEPGSRSIAVYVRIANPERELRAGMFAQGRLLVVDKEAATVIPVAALREEAGVSVVYRIQAGRLVREVVQVGARDRVEGLVKITSGLAPGAQVVVGPLANLQPDLAVRITGAAGGTPVSEP